MNFNFCIYMTTDNLLSNQRLAENSVRFVSGEVDISLTSAPITVAFSELNNSSIILFAPQKIVLLEQVFRSRY